MTESFKLRLTAVEYAAPGVNRYRFSSLDGMQLPAFEPGAHIDVQLSDEVTRQYSLLWPSPAPSDYVIAVQVSEAGKGGSRALHYGSVVGASYSVSAPRNHFELEQADVEYCLLAGGIGITPIISMYRQLKQAGRRVRLHYWAASLEHMLFRSELVGDPDVQLYPTRHGQTSATRLKDVLGGLAHSTRRYCCGPTAMVDAFDQLTADCAPGLARRERFSAAVDALQPGDDFRVLLQRSGLILAVGPEQSLLQACEAAGVSVDYSCEEGICGACEVKVLAGQVDHRDSVLTDKERALGTRMMICCSRGVGDSLVLDI